MSVSVHSAKSGREIFSANSVAMGRHNRSSQSQCAQASRVWKSVASLGWVTPGVATEGVTPLFFHEKPGDLFSVAMQFCGVTPDFFFTKTTFFPHQFIAFYCFHSGVTSLEGVIPHLFYLSDLVSPLFFVNLPTKFFSFRCHPWRVSPGAAAPPASDATDENIWINSHVRPVLSQKHTQEFLARI